MSFLPVAAENSEGIINTDFDEPRESKYGTPRPRHLLAKKRYRQLYVRYRKRKMCTLEISVEIVLNETETSLT